MIIFDTVSIVITFACIPYIIISVFGKYNNTSFFPIFTSSVLSRISSISYLSHLHLVLICAHLSHLLHNLVKPSHDPPETPFMFISTNATSYYACNSPIWHYSKVPHKHHPYKIKSQFSKYVNKVERPKLNTFSPAVDLPADHVLLTFIPCYSNI